MPTTDHTLIADLLTVLKVPFTQDYTRQRFDAMPFQTLCGVTQLLKEYGVESAGLRLGDKGELNRIPPPFIAQTEGGLVIVTKVSPSAVNYLTQGVPESMPVADFDKAFTGVVVIPPAGPHA